MPIWSIPPWPIRSTSSKPATTSKPTARVSRCATPGPGPTPTVPQRQQRQLDRRQRRERRQRERGERSLADDVDAVWNDFLQCQLPALLLLDGRHDLLGRPRKRKHEPLECHVAVTGGYSAERWDHREWDGGQHRVGCVRPVDSERNDPLRHGIEPPFGTVADSTC